jgi:transposase
MASRKKKDRNLYYEVLHEKHLKYVHFRKAGVSNNQAAFLVGFRAETGSRIWRKYQKGGDEALRPRKRGVPPGYRRALTPDQEKETKTLLRGSTPESLNLPYLVWNRISVKHLIWERFAVKLASRTISLYFARWGLTCRQKKIEILEPF